MDNEVLHLKVDPKAQEAYQGSRGINMKMMIIMTARQR